MNRPLIGADPELFLETDGSGILRSAIGRIGGTKANPRPLERVGFALQEDNVAVEFNIPPAHDVQQFVESISWTMNKIKEEVKTQNLRPSPIASAVFPPGELLDPRAHNFGCDPDFNAWTIPVEMNPRPNPANRSFRTCGGHIHVGLLKSPDEEQFYLIDFVRAMDLFLGVPSVAMDEDQDRRQLYGKAGAHRLTNYGFEYRTLSNFWIKSQALSKWAYEQSIRAYEWVLSFHESANLQGLWLAVGDSIQKCINEGDVNLCAELCTDYNLELVDVH